jgi:hypothetical protein
MVCVYGGASTSDLVWLFVLLPPKHAQKLCTSNLVDRPLNHGSTSGSGASRCVEGRLLYVLML